MTAKNTVTVSPVDMKSRKELDLRAGDTVRVMQRIPEGGKWRLQAFEGLLIARKHGTEAGATFTIRKVSNGVGVEKVFPLYSPMIDSVKVVKRARVRRAKLYYIREKVAREAKRALRRQRVVRDTVIPAAEITDETTPVETATGAEA
jgi:large subunit ribosomal protein L19